MGSGCHATRRSQFQIVSFGSTFENLFVLGGLRLEGEVITEARQYVKTLTANMGKVSSLPVKSWRLVAVEAYFKFTSRNCDDDDGDGGDGDDACPCGTTRISLTIAAVWYTDTASIETQVAQICWIRCGMYSRQPSVAFGTPCSSSQV